MKNKTLFYVVLTIFILLFLYINFLSFKLVKYDVKKKLYDWKLSLIEDHKLEIPIKHGIFLRNKFISGDFFYINKIIPNKIYFDKYKRRIYSINYRDKNLIIYIGSIFFSNGKGSLEYYLYKKYGLPFYIKDISKDKVNVDIYKNNIGKNVILYIFLLFFIIIIFHRKKAGSYISSLLFIFTILYLKLSIVLILIPLLLLLCCEKNYYISILLAIFSIILSFILPYLGIFILFILFLKLLKYYNSLFLWMYILSNIILLFINPLYGLLIFPLLILIKYKKKFPLLIFLWFYTIFASFVLTFTINEFQIFKWKMKNISKNPNIKVLIKNNNTNFLSYIINELKFKNNISRISILDKNKLLLDQSPSKMFSFKIPIKNNRSYVSINHIKYKYEQFLLPIQDKNNVIAYLQGEIIYNTNNFFKILLNHLNYTGLLFILFFIFYFLFNYKVLKASLSKKVNKIFAIIFLLLFIIIFIILLFVGKSYMTTRKEYWAEELQNNMVNYFLQIRAKTNELASKFDQLFKIHKEGEYKIGNNVVYFSNNIEIKDDYTPLLFNGQYCIGRQMNDGVLIIPFTSIYSKDKQNTKIFITIMAKDQIYFNSNIRSVITGELNVKKINEFIYYKDGISFSIKPSLQNNFVYTFFLPVRMVDFKLTFYFGIFFYIYIVLFFIIKIIYGYFNRELLLLENGFLQIRSGNYDYQINIPQDSNFKQLFEDFNFMIKRLKLSRQRELENESLKNMEIIAKKIAHEIKNPLTPISMLISHLKNSYKNDPKIFNEEFEESINIIDEQISYLKQIADEFYTLGRFSNIKKVYFNLEDFIKEIKGMYDTVMKKNNIKWNISYEKAILYLDKNILRHIFINIIENSIYVVRDKDEKEIKIDIYVKNENIYMVFSDTGGGVPKDKLEEIFKSNYSTKSAGMGIGLSFVKKSVEVQNGSVKAINGEKGLIIEIIFPVS